jgi:hypothetical protein
MPSPDDCEYLRPYRDAVRACGPTFPALLWHSRAYQQVRFTVLTEAIRAAIMAGHASRRCPLAGRVFVDLGCGCGDYALHLREERVEFGRFIGVEAVEALADASRQALRGLPDAAVLEADFAADPAVVERLAASGGDVFVISGSLNTMDEGLARQVLERTWRTVARVRRGVLAFNFLSDRFGLTGPDAGGPARRFDTVAILTWALRACPNVVFRHDYLGGRDATIVMVAEA